MDAGDVCAVDIWSSTLDAIHPFWVAAEWASETKYTSIINLDVQSSNDTIDMYVVTKKNYDAGYHIFEGACSAVGETHIVVPSCADKTCQISSTITPAPGYTIILEWGSPTEYTWGN